MKLLGVFERKIVQMLGACESWRPATTSYGIYQLQHDVVRDICKYGIAEELDYDGDYPRIFRLTALGRLHLEFEDLPIMEQPDV